jgi:glycosyltransferase involved in cell wall biosynthesis
MDRTKGLHFLVQGFASLVNVLDYPVCLVMIGPEGVASGPTRIAVQKMKILDKVRWVFPVTQEEKLAAYRDADLFVTTANYRSGGILTALEAIQCGTPAVVTEEVAEFFENADLRDCIVKYGNLEQFRDAMKHFLDNPREGQVVVERGRKYITEHLLWPKVVKKFEQIYEDCVKK